MHPNLIEVGPLALPTYGVLVAVGVFLALFIAGRRAESEGMDRGKVFDFGLTVVLFSLVGSKAALAIVNPGEFFHSLSSFISLIRSGGVFYGGFLFGVAAAVVMIRRANLPVWKLGDLYCSTLPLGQAIGRLGCFSAGCCWGRECSLPWAVTFTDTAAAAITGVPLHHALHPTQLYLSLMGFLLFFLMSHLHRRRSFDGQVLLAYVMLYAAGRFLLEFFRGDPRGTLPWGGFSTSQALAIPIFLTASILYVRRRASVHGGHG